jgi:5'-3' exonuclease
VRAQRAAPPSRAARESGPRRLRYHPAIADDAAPAPPLVVDLVDGTYELFRHFYSPGAKGAKPGDRAAVRGVMGTVLRMLETGATHLGVATDHVIESFRNRLWRGYKTGAGLDPALVEQFHPLEEALAALGVVVWPMVELEADDALATAAALAAADPRVAQVRIWTPDKDLAQCVRGHRVVQVDRRSGTVRDEAGVIAKYGVPPASIPDWLALVGDSADGYPGIPGWGAKSAAAVLARFGHLADVPLDGKGWGLGARGPVLAWALAERREEAALFVRLATLREDAPLGTGVEDLAWRGPRPELAELAARLGAPGMVERAKALLAARQGGTG